MRSSCKFGELISCFGVHMVPIFVECPTSNGEDLFLTGTTVVGSGSFVESFWAGEYSEVLI